MKIKPDMIINVVLFLMIVGLGVVQLYGAFADVKTIKTLQKRISGLEKEQARLSRAVDNIIDEQIEQMHSK